MESEGKSSNHNPYMSVTLTIIYAGSSGVVKWKAILGGNKTNEAFRSYLVPSLSQVMDRPHIMKVSVLGLPGEVDSL